MPTPWWHLLATITAWAFAIAGAALLLHALFHDRSRGRKRCPKCWYDMAGAPTLTCPECGRTARKPRHLLRTHRHYRRALALLLLVGLPAYLLNNAPRIAKQGWSGGIPSIVLIGFVQLTDRSPSPLGPQPPTPLRTRSGVSDDRPGLVLAPPAPRTGSASPATALVEELQRRCIAGELLLHERHALSLFPTLHVRRHGANWADESPRAEWFAFLLDGALLPRTQVRRLQLASLETALEIPDVWVRGEPILCTPKWDGPIAFDEIKAMYTFQIVVIPEWTGSPAATLARVVVDGDQSNPVTLPACPEGKPCRLRLEMRHLGMATSICCRTVHGPRRWVDSCEQMVPPHRDPRLLLALREACSIRGTDRTGHTLEMNIKSLRLPPDVAFGFTATLYRGSSPTEVAHVGLRPQATTAFLAAPFVPATPKAPPSTPDAPWRLHIKSDPCAILKHITATRCWEGEFTIDLDPLAPGK